MVKEVNVYSEYKEIITKNAKVAVDFSATWCGPCKRISPKFDELSHDARYAGIVFIKVDVDENAEAAAEEGVEAMPTFLFFVNGVKQDELVGADANALEAKLTKLSEA